jgi:trehalose/maltose hydrolase-like predicted phosphorylase
MDFWKLDYNGYDPGQEGLREALCTLGNGYFATRGAAEESHAGDCHYPGTYLSGGYNRLESVIAGRTIENEDLVNWPNWLPLTFRAEDDKHWFKLEETELISYRQTLNMKDGILERNIHFKDYKGREFRILSQRIVSMDNQHVAAISLILTAVNWSGRIQVRSTLDGSVKNEGVERYKKLNSQHLDVIESGEKDNSFIYLLVQTNQSKRYMAQAARCRIYKEDKQVHTDVIYENEDKKISEIISFRVEKDIPVRIEKTVLIYSSGDFAISEPLSDALSNIEQTENFEILLQKHKNTWRRFWYRFDIEINDTGNTQMLLRLHIFHLLQTCSHHTIERDTGVPARGWHGEAYRGHIFWDEVFIFPLLNMRMPELTRSLLLYRYHRLNAARRLAEKEGYRGAMFPWQSGSNGREESQVIHLNPKSGRWNPDNTHLQRHVNLTIAYNIWRYFEVTRDSEFMKFYGIEMLLEIAHFFSSLSLWNENKKRYEILKVVGPDEFHTSYPGSDEPGINNNAYTNIMAAWLFSHALKSIEILDGHQKAELPANLGINEAELIRWDDLSRKLFVPFIDNKIISHFEGYEKLKELDWEGYRKKYDNIQRLDRILDAEGDSINNYKASKQGDVLMLFYLFSSEELQEIFTRLDYEFHPAEIPEMVSYYRDRTSDGSTLSRIVRSWVESRSDREFSWNSFKKAVLSDFEDVQGGTTPEGIHLGSMAGTVDIIQRCYPGIAFHDDMLWLNPALPEELNFMKFRIFYREHWLSIYIDSAQCRIMLEGGVSSTVKIGFVDEVFELSEGIERKFDLKL